MEENLKQAQKKAYEKLKKTGCYAVIYGFKRGVKDVIPLYPPLCKKSQEEVDQFVKAFSTGKEGTKIVVYVLYKSQIPNLDIVFGGKEMSKELTGPIDGFENLGATESFKDMVDSSLVDKAIAIYDTKLNPYGINDSPFSEESEYYDELRSNFSTPAIIEDYIADYENETDPDSIEFVDTLNKILNSIKPDTDDMPPKPPYLEPLEEEVEEDMYGFEAMSISNLESLTSALAKALEVSGSVTIINKFIDEDLDMDFNDQLTFIKNTVDLSNSKLVMDEILSAAETLLDDVQIELLTESLEGGVQVPEEEEFGEIEGEYEEPEDWSTVDEEEPIGEEEEIEEIEEIQEEPVDEEPVENIPEEENI